MSFYQNINICLWPKYKSRREIRKSIKRLLIVVDFLFMKMAELQSNMPPGWDCKKDEATGRFYFINHYTRTTTWEDPRNRHKPFQSTPKHISGGQTEYIQLQHGSPDSRRNYVYPTHTSPLPAFEMPALTSPKNYPLQDMKPRKSPLTVRSPKVQDSSLSSTSDIDEAVMKVAAMFPTVSEAHIQLLLRNCRYMKSIFPKADETLILEILQNNENSIQKTSDALKDMGFDKKDTVKVAQQKLEAKKEEERKEEENKIIEQPIPEPLIKTAEDKQKMKASLQEKYNDVAEHLISIALESVNFDESRANQILQIMIKEDNQAANIRKTEVEEVINISDVPSTSSASVLPISQSRQSLKSLLKAEKELEKASFPRVVEENVDGYRSQNLSNTKGPNPEHAKGANEKLLLEDYVKWQGANPILKLGSQGLAKGPNASLLSNRSYRPCGPNKDLRKGPKFGLAKGSMFSQMKTVVVGQSRGK